MNPHLEVVSVALVKKWSEKIKINLFTSWSIVSVLRGFSQTVTGKYCHKSIKQNNVFSVSVTKKTQKCDKMANYRTNQKSLFISSNTKRKGLLPISMVAIVGFLSISLIIPTVYGKKKCFCYIITWSSGLSVIDVIIAINGLIHFNKLDEIRTIIQILDLWGSSNLLWAPFLFIV